MVFFIFFIFAVTQTEAETVRMAIRRMGEDWNPSFWEHFEKWIAIERIWNHMLHSDNPYEFEVDWPAKYWSNKTLDNLKSGTSVYRDKLLLTNWQNYISVSPKCIEAEWIDYTDCDRDKCKDRYNAVYDDLNPELYICIYCGTKLHIKILQNDPF
jgi:hypothetical protein